MQAVGAAIAGLQADSPLVVVHGGGKAIDAALARAGLAKTQVDGLRVTDEATLDVVVSVLAGLVNTRLVAAVTAAGGGGVGLTGADGGICIVTKAMPLLSTAGTTVDLGRVGVPVAGPAPAGPGRARRRCPPAHARRWFRGCPGRAAPGAARS